MTLYAIRMRLWEVKDPDAHALACKLAGFPDDLDLSDLRELNSLVARALKHYINKV